MVHGCEHYLTTYKESLFTCQSGGLTRIRNEDDKFFAEKNGEEQLIFDEDKFCGLTGGFAHTGIYFFLKDFGKKTKELVFTLFIEQFIIDKDKIYALCQNDKVSK